MTRRIETQVAIRTKQQGRFHYNQYVDNGPGGPINYTKLTVEAAKKQLNLYTKDSEPTVVTREILIDEGEWVEVEVSEFKNLAELLHKKQCHYNHVDQCDWDYGNNTSIHKKYEEKAKALLKKTNFETIKELLDLM